MNPKEKAKELVEKFMPHAYPFEGGSGYLTGEKDEAGQLRCAKELAIIAVDELIQEHTWGSPISWNEVRKKYWQAVKTEITNL